MVSVYMNHHMVVIEHVVWNKSVWFIIFITYLVIKCKKIINYNRLIDERKLLANIKYNNMQNITETKTNIKIISISDLRN